MSDRPRLLTERASAATEAASLPVQIATVARQLEPARLAWLARLRALAMAEIERCVVDLADPSAAIKELQRTHQRDEYGWQPPERRTPPDEAAAMRRQWDTLAAEAQPITLQMNWARQMVAMTEGMANHGHLRSVSLTNPNTWPDAA